MRIVSETETGIRIRVDDEDDLWTLSKVCTEGAEVGMLTHRRDSTTGTQAVSYTHLTLPTTLSV